MDNWFVTASRSERILIDHSMSASASSHPPPTLRSFSPQKIKKKPEDQEKAGEDQRDAEDQEEAGGTTAADF